MATARSKAVGVRRSPAKGWGVKLTLAATVIGAAAGIFAVFETPLIPEIRCTFLNKECPSRSLISDEQLKGTERQEAFDLGRADQALTDSIRRTDEEMHRLDLLGENLRKKPK